MAWCFSILLHSLLEDQGGRRLRHAYPAGRIFMPLLDWLFAYVHSSTDPPVRAYHVLREDLLRLRSCNETTDLPNPNM